MAISLLAEEQCETDLAKFRHLGTSLQVFGKSLQVFCKFLMVYFLYDKMMSRYGKFVTLLG